MDASLVNKEHSPELLIPPLCEILWRYLLVAPKEQRNSLTLINNNIGEKMRLWKPKFVDLEDSRRVILAYNKGLVPVDTRLYAPLPASAMSIMFQLIIPLVVPGCEDLFPPLLRLSINRLWDSLINREYDDRIAIENVRVALFHFV
jgi:hypothetical protein